MRFALQIYKKIRDNYHKFTNKKRPNFTIFAVKLGLLYKSRLVWRSR